jgi:hypothetical protein
VPILPIQIPAWYCRCSIQSSSFPKETLPRELRGDKRPKYTQSSVLGYGSRQASLQVNQCGVIGPCRGREPSYLRGLASQANQAAGKIESQIADIAKPGRWENRKKQTFLKERKGEVERRYASFTPRYIRLPYPPYDAPAASKAWRPPPSSSWLALSHALKSLVA